MTHVHTIRASTLADFMTQVDRITADCVERGVDYTVSALRGTSGEWSALITTREKTNA